MVEHGLPVEPAHKVNASGPQDAASAVPNSSRRTSESDLVLDILMQCAAVFGTERARFVRQAEFGIWHVHTMQQGNLTTHTADHAEIAMAWMVGLSRFPIRVTRPRVTQPDGSGVRPIAVTSYLGIPILCQDHFVGVIELAGNVGGDLERTLERVSTSLTSFGERMTHDPSLRSMAQLERNDECMLSGGFWGQGQIALGTDEWRVVSALDSARFLRELMDQAGLSEDNLIDAMHNLLAMGLVTVRASTRVLVDTGELEREPAAVSGHRHLDRDVEMPQVRRREISPLRSR